jgi:hypothetical protein
MRFLISTLLFLSYVFHATCSGEVLQEFHLSQKIECIPQEERLFLEKFFCKLIRSEGLGYVLFGSKPMCLSGYFTRLPLGNLLRGSENFAIKRGWEVWKKYEHLFPHPKYLVFEELNVSSDEDLHLIYFINKNNLLRILNSNYVIFRKELSEDFDPKKILEEISAKKIVSSIIRDHEGLLGILLGYGAESSMQYYRRDLMWKSQPPLLYEEVNLQAVSPYPYEKSIFVDIHPIQFVGNSQSEEVKKILEQNATERSCLIDIYSHGKTLEITLQKLME